MRLSTYCVGVLLVVLTISSAAGADWTAKPFVDLRYDRPAVGGDWLYFFVYAYPVERVDLWRTDGSLGGTDRVYSITPSYSATDLVSMGGNLYFLSSYYGSAKLWKVVPDTAQLTLLETLPDGVPQTPFAAGNALYFILDDRLYRTDGTPGGAVSIEVGQWQWCRFLCAFGNRALYILERETYLRDLYCSDGTSGGTVLLGSFGYDFVICDERIYIAMKQNGGFAVAAPRDDPPLGKTVNGQFYFSATTAPGGIQGMWKTDGTVEGTVLVKSGMIPLIRSGNNGVFFVGDGCEGGGLCLWFTDGTEEGSVSLHSILFESGVGGFNVVNGLACFMVGDFDFCELWKSDGTVGGTAKLTDIGSGLVASPDVFGDKLIFESYSLDTGLFGLWKTDGTAPGTACLTQLEPSWIGWPVLVGDSFFFGYEAETGNQLWVSDWTPAGTHAVPGIPSDTQDLYDMVAFKNSLYFGNEGTGQIWVCQSETPPEVDVCDPGHVLVSELDGFESFINIYWPWMDEALHDLGMEDYHDYDLENVHLTIAGGAPAPEPGDGWYDWFELRLVEYVLCKDNFWAHDLVQGLFNQNKLLFEQDIATLYAASITQSDPDGDPRLLMCGELFGNLVPAAALLSVEMRDTMDGLLALGFGDGAAPFTILPQISSYATCCEGLKVTGALFSPDGDLDNDGTSNLDEFNTVMAATGNYEAALIAVEDENNFWPGNPEMPVGGLFGLAILGVTLGLSGVVLSRKK